MGRKKQTGTEQRTLLQGKPVLPDGFYAGDKLNENIASFVRDYLRENPYDPLSDEYSVVAFNEAINTTKMTTIYNMHRYDSKKPHTAIRSYVRHYTRPGDLVLDPFCGSGGTALAALMEGRKALAIDRSPAATFITKNSCTPLDIEWVRERLDGVKARAAAEIDPLYTTICDRCGEPARIAFTVYSQTFECKRCLSPIPLFDCEHTEILDGDGRKTIANCPLCAKNGHIEQISTRGTKTGVIPVLTVYHCLGSCRPTLGERRHNDSDPQKRIAFEVSDAKKVEEIELGAIPHWYPTRRMMNADPEQQKWGVKWRAGTSNFRTVDELYTKRNLWALAVWRNLADQEDPCVRDIVLFAVTAMAKGTSTMCQYDSRWSFPYPIMSGTYYVPQIFKEPNVYKAVADKIDAILKGVVAVGTDQPAWISTQSAADLSNIPSNSIDYIFTDPPYAGNVQYGELNFVWEAWLNVDTHWHHEEIVVNEVRGLTEKDWEAGIRAAMAHCLRVLKPGRWLSLCYHDTSEGTWSLVQDIMAEVGFVVDKSDTAVFIDTNQKSYNQYTADKVTKRDLVINFRKPKPNEVTGGLEISGDEDQDGFSAKIRLLIGDYVAANPGAPKDRIYDHVVSRMVRAGTMQAHNFEEYLGQVAEPVHEAVKKNLFEDKDPDLFGTHEVVRWYLKSTQLDVVDAAESAKEEDAAEKLSRFIQTKLKAAPWSDGVHYSDLFEHFIYSVRDKPRRPMTEWLLDYFYKTESGAYRLPATVEEARIKAEGRSKGTGRRIKRYLGFLEQSVAIPTGEQQNDSTLADWIRHAKLSGMYEAGKMLFERGGLSIDRLSEEAAVNVEEDYQVCVRMLSRQEKG